ncbi:MULTISPECIES: hypothetical protein [Brevibacillus]|uniref:Uncharacterized protein n=1 Tax=Brevibacillus brevis TaxID=1393 RepID=A0ABY9TCQ9_BREBE|nr:MULTISPECIES: hypothetical protein [Brevibacillus]MBG9568462.1 hypothetical protein [Brevibacillus agri]WNC17905.1 hypothetical protein RGB73_30515 [Brevibacillus brevis]
MEKISRDTSVEEKENYSKVEVQALRLVLDRFQKGDLGEISFVGKPVYDSLEEDRFRPFVGVSCSEYHIDGEVRRAFYLSGQESRRRGITPELTEDVEKAADFLMRYKDFESVYVNGKYLGERSLFLQDPYRTGPTLKEVLYYSKELTDGVPTKIPMQDLDKEVQSWELDKDGNERLIYSIKDEPINHTVIFKEHETTNVFRDKVYEGILKGDQTTVKELNYVIEKTFEKVFEFDR